MVLRTPRGNNHPSSFVSVSNYKCAVPKELRLTDATKQAEKQVPAAHDADDRLVEGVLTILRMSRVMERIDAGVRPQQYRMLKLIGGGGERSARLAEKLAVAKPTLTSTADSLVAAGLAVRQAEPGDRRVVRLCLTPAGQAVTERADAAYAAWFGSLLDHTGRGDQILADLLRLSDAMTERHRARLAADAGVRR
jgi:DNA-binding MarR family transcriptional regulator